MWDQLSKNRPCCDPVMELSCDRATATPRATLSAEAPVFRPSRDAAVAARARIKDAAELTDDDS